jgi:hypothetical protein
MSLFEPALALDCTQAELDILQRPIEAERDGGHQRLMREILEGLDRGKRVLLIEPALLRKAEHFAYDYGPGGYQTRFRTLVSLARRQGWTE